MKRIKFYCFLLFFSSFLWSYHSTAQDWIWANYIPWTLNIQNGSVFIEINPGAITHDAAGNAYVTGYMYINDLFANSHNGYLFFIAKFNATGHVMWVKQCGEPFESYLRGKDIIADAGGNIYVIGDFKGTLQLSRTISLKSTGDLEDIFIAKYNSQGVVQWARKVCGSSRGSGQGIALDTQGSILITGFIQGTTSFGNNVVVADASPNSHDYFIANYDQSGNAIWVKRSMSTNDNNAWGRRIGVDSQGQIWTVGQYKHDMFIDNTMLTALPNLNQPGDDYDIFVAKHDAAGNVLWAKSYGGNNVENPGNIACDAQGNGYITGNFYDYISLDNITLTTLDSSDAFVAKINGSGNVLWAKGINGGEYNEGNGIDIDANDNCYVTGSLSAEYRSKLFVKKYEPNGDLDWTRIVAYNNSNNYGEVRGNDISTDAMGNCYVAGKFEGDLISFGNINVLGTYGNQPQDFIQQGIAAHLSATDLIFPPYMDPGDWEEWPLPPGPDPTSLLQAYPNPSDDIITLQFRNPGRDPGYLGIYDQRGILIYIREFSGDLEQRISFRQYGKGYYYARVIVEKEAHMQTIMIE